jgi:magnesium chelatase accessory protein
MTYKPLWEIEGRDWPNRAASRFVKAAGLTWHVQIMGTGPVLLLIHGTGAATHSWRALAPLLGDRFTIVAPDLPGHGFTDMQSRRQLSLPHISADLARLLESLDVRPAAVAGHSAGAAIALRMALDGRIAPRALVSLNGALMPFTGLAEFLYPALAKLLFLNPFAGPVLACRAADPAAVRRLIEGTGSSLDAEGLDLYGRLLRTTRHVEAAMGMMANWNLRPLQDDLPRLSIPLTLVAAERDRAVPPRVARETAPLVPNSNVILVPGRGHLGHEEAPAEFAEIIRNACV